MSDNCLVSSSVIPEPTVQPDTHWGWLARHWSLLGTPLRPCAEDVAIMEQLAFRAPNGCRRAALLGVTSELAGMSWPDSTFLQAFDCDQNAIMALWSPERRTASEAICANWFALPLDDSSMDMVAGDGVLSTLASAGDYQKLFRELARVLTSGGVLALRLFAAPAAAVTVADIFADLWAGRIGNFNTFRWRLAMALTDPVDHCVTVSDIWDAWHAAVPVPEQLAEELGWPLPVISVIDRHRNNATRYSFPPFEVVSNLAAPWFHPEEIHIPSYQDAERYPTVCFRKI